MHEDKSRDHKRYFFFGRKQGHFCDVFFTKNGLVGVIHGSGVWSRTSSTDFLHTQDDTDTRWYVLEGTFGSSINDAACKTY